CIAQAQIRLRGSLHQRLLLGDIDRNADKMRPATRLLDQLAACAQPYPIAFGVAHAKGMIDERCSGVGKLNREVIELNILRMDEGIHFAKAQQTVARGQTENCEHGMRPEDAPACEVPVPQPAATAIERGIDARTHGFIDYVRFACARSLPMKRKAE